MAILKKKELKKTGPKELSTKLAELQLELAKERASIALGASVSSPGRIRQIRRTIAKIKGHLPQAVEQPARAGKEGK